MTRIVLFIKRISRESGGLSSAWDLAESLQELGNDVTVIVGRKSLSIKRQLTSISSFKSQKVLLNREYVDPLKRGGLRNGIKAMYWRITCNDKRCAKAIAHADFIVDAGNLNFRALNRIKSESSGLLIRNHAGSPEKFEKYWLDNIDQNFVSKNKKEKYLEYCARYDGLLFQSVEQESEYLNRTNQLWKKCLTFTLKPSCQELEVLKVKNTKISFYDPSLINVAIVGSVQYVKGLDLVLKTLKSIASKNSRIHFHIVGQYQNDESELGKYYQELRTYVDIHGLNEHVTFHGFRTNYLEYMHGADIVMQPSRAEGVSRILREAMLLGKLIVVYSISGTRDLLEDKETAFLIQPFDYERMADITLEIISKIHDESIEVIKKRAYLAYMENNSKEVYKKRIGEIFSQEVVIANGR